MKYRKRVALAILALLCTAITVLVARQFKTVAQQEAEASPPPASIMTVPVTNEKFYDSIPVQCSLDYGMNTPLMPSTDVSANAQYTKIAIVKDEELRQGSLIAEINGAPVFFGVGSFSFYRDLHIGDTGPDAKMLNDILTELGYQYSRYGTEASTFDETTVAALGSLYSAFDYPTPKNDTGFSASSFIVMSGPQKVISTPRTTGTVASEPIANVSGAGQQIICKGLSGELSPEIVAGMPVILHLPGVELRTAINNISDTTDKAVNNDKQSQATQTNASLEKKFIASKPQEIPDTVKNISGDVILSESSGDLPVVPSSALWTKDGKTFVTVVTNDVTTDVPVNVLYSAGGFNEVQAVSGSLTTNDEVKIINGGN